MESKHYSLVFLPCSRSMSLVRHLKEALANIIGWYNSKNSDAHITILEFNATDAELEFIKRKIRQLADTERPDYVYLDKYEAFPQNGAFFIAPTDYSKNYLKNIMNRFVGSLNAKNIRKSNDPHMSIARKLNADKLAIALERFESISLNFFCDRVVLRIYDKGSSQYQFADEFKFGSKMPASPAQFRLDIS
ncbi:Uncharacterised protein [Sphingobacterium spiritivorum]|uniref:2'-5' RNA ligase n=1 Tax=Sphingobacterium spiritivorum TaxID=258 RepID=A0A380CX73_SPHSI|nr:2'-5' RNA ligase family protein [Sphingobacterium spiritivorum]SUJ29326.1 Uncharacterised protein [Sphingobacterium spiritivorum]